MAYIRWMQSSFTTHLSWTRDRITRINIYSRSQRMTARTRGSTDVSRQNLIILPVILANLHPGDLSRESEKEGRADRTSATYRRHSTWRQYLSISIRPFFREAVERACRVRMEDYVTRVRKTGMVILFSSCFFMGGMGNSRSIMQHNSYLINIVLYICRERKILK